MALPEQIRKQTEAVQELYNQLNASEDSGNQQNTAEANADDSYQDQQDSFDSQNVSADAQSDTEEASPPSANEQTSGGKKKKSEETLAQKYRTLQGMYNAEVPRLHAQNRDLTNRIQHLEQLLSTLSSSTTSAPSPTFESLITDKDVEDYGESIDVMRKVSREEYVPVAQKIAELESTLKSLQTSVVPQVQSLAQRQAATTEQQFWAQLNGAVPNWKHINDDPDFQTWLLQTDPLTGISRQTILEDAQRTYDVARITSFFQTWQEITGQANVAQNSQRSAPASDLQKQVAPGRGRSTGNASATGATGKTYTPNDIRGFFDAVRSGKYKGREQERDRIERDIFAAQREGRIVVNA
jgi:hypothetical protein